MKITELSAFFPNMLPKFMFITAYYNQDLLQGSTDDDKCQLFQ